MSVSRSRLSVVLLLLLLLLLGGAALIVFETTPFDAPVTPVAAPDNVDTRDATHDVAPVRRDRPRTHNGDALSASDATAPGPAPSVERTVVDGSNGAARLHVTVRDAAGGTVANARVVAFDPFSSMNDASGSAAWSQTATTDAGGKVTLEFGKERMSFLQVIAEREGLAGLSDRVNLQPKGSESIEIVLVPATRLVGSVTDNSGAPLVGARLVAQFRVDSTMGFALTTQTDERGGYVFAGVPTSILAASQAVSAHARGHSSASLAFETRPGDVRLDFELEAGRTVVGRCVEAGGLPVTRARIVWESAETEAGDDGRFEVGVLPLRGGAITIVPESFAPVRILVPAGPPGEADLGEITVRAGRSISGQVIDRDGKPIAGALVNILSLDLGLWLRAVTTGEDGRFEFAHMDEGLHRLIAMKYLPNGVQLETEQTDVPVGTSDLRLTIGGGTSVLVKFLSALDRSVVKVDDATISATSTDTGAKGATWGYAGSNLTQARIQVEQAGVYDVTVKIPGYDVGLAAGVAVNEGQETVIDVLFSKRPE